MYWVVSVEKGGASQIVEASNYAEAIANTPGGQSARIAQYMDKVRFGLIDEEVPETPEPDTPPYDDV